MAVAVAATMARLREVPPAPERGYASMSHSGRPSGRPLVVSQQPPGNLPATSHAPRRPLLCAASVRGLREFKDASAQPATATSRAWIAFGVRVLGVIVAGAMMAISSRRGEGGEHMSRLGWVCGGAIIIGSASALVGTLA